MDPILEAALEEANARAAASYSRAQCLAAQLVACLGAARGAFPVVLLNESDPEWSSAYQATIDLRRRLEGIPKPPDLAAIRAARIKAETNFPRMFPIYARCARGMCMHPEVSHRIPEGDCSVHRCGCPGFLVL